MADLSTTFMGLALENPILAGSCGLTSTLEGVRKAVSAGAGAVVLKSVFEEQLLAELEPLSGAAGSHPEAEAFLAGMGVADAAGDYLALVRGAKALGAVPVVASLNCAGEASWASFARRIEAAGADAIELNLGVLPVDPKETAESLEGRLARLVASVAGAVGVPVCAKLGSSYTNVGNVALALSRAGARGLTLFNRFYRLDIDLDSMSLSPGPMRGGPDACHESLRWIALLEGRVGAELCASGGVHDGATALKLVAAGAGAVQMCSALYASGYGAITSALMDMRAWMDGKGVRRLADLRGRLSRRNSDSPAAYGRMHYVKALTGQS